MLLSEGIQHKAAVGRPYPMALGRELGDPGQVSWPPSLSVPVYLVAVGSARVDLCLLPCLPLLPRDPLRVVAGQERVPRLSG